MADDQKHPDKPHGVQVVTPYGKRRTCGECGRRWTRIYHPGSTTLIGTTWVEEKYSPLRDNLRSDDDAHGS